MTLITRRARIDLLFTMSDITRTSTARRSARILFLTNEISNEQAVWWSQTGSNRRPPACKAGALPTELWPLASRRRPVCRAAARAGQSPAFALRTTARQPSPRFRERRLVGLGRFELPTSRLSSARSNQLSYKPEPGVSGQKPVIRGRFVVSDYRPLNSSFAKKEKRRRRRPANGQNDREIDLP